MGKNKGKKGKRKNRSESSTPQSSTPPVDDETRPLVRGGACGSSEPRTQSSNPNLGATSSRDAPEYRRLSEVDTLSVPDQGAAAGGSPKSPRKSPIRSLKDSLIGKLSPKSKSRCVCKDKKNHDPECCEMKRLSAGDKSESPKSKSPKRLSPRSKQDENLGQSSSSSVPSVESAAEPDKNLLAVPNPESSPVGFWKNSWERFIDKWKVSWRRRRRSNRSDSGGSCEEKSGCSEKDPKTKSPNRSQTKSGTSSSGTTSSISKSKGSDASSGNSRRSSSKSSSTPDSKVLECPSKKSSKKTKNKTPSRNQTDYDPQEGTSRGPRSGSRREGKSHLYWHDELLKLYIGDLTGVTFNDVVPILERVDEDPEEHAPISPLPRRRSKSTSKYAYRLASDPPPSSPQPEEPSPLNLWLPTFEWRWFEDVKNRRQNESNAQRGDEVQDDGNAQPHEDPLSDPFNQPDEKEQRIINRIDAERLDPTVTRHESISPKSSRRCLCKDKYIHEMGCSYLRRMRDRRMMRKCRQEVLTRK